MQLSGAMKLNSILRRGPHSRVSMPVAMLHPGTVIRPQTWHLSIIAMKAIPRTLTVQGRDVTFSEISVTYTDISNISSSLFVGFFTSSVAMLGSIRPLPIPSP